MKPVKAAEFCTCTEHQCPFNPVNNSKGCDLCILKCLKLNEKPSSILKKKSKEIKKIKPYHIQNFIYKKILY